MGHRWRRATFSMAGAGAGRPYRAWQGGHGKEGRAWQGAGRPYRAGRAGQGQGKARGG
jgi:hypothetical protein